MRTKGPAARDDAMVLARLNARLAGIEREIPQARPWRPPASHSVQGAHTRGRVRMSWSASIIAAAVAVAAIGTSFVISTAPSQPAGAGSAPAAETASPSPDASVIPAGDLAVPVVGTMTYTGGVSGEGRSEGVSADFIEWARDGEGFTLLTTQMSDPRLSGTLKRYERFDDFGWPGRIGSGLELMWGTFRIENEGGAWEGSYRGATMWDVEDLGTPPPSLRNVPDTWDDWTWDAWLEGSGDYEGLSAWIRTDVKDFAMTSPVVGLIFPGPLPPDR
jgi:hypothetical protein